MNIKSGFNTYAAWMVVACLLLVSGGARAQGFLKLQRDSLPLFRGFSVSVDLAGLAQMQLGDYGQYEGALRLNLNNQYFPIFELGYGKASHVDDEVTGISYRTQAPYFRIGADVNIMKNKRSDNRIFAGLRYAFTSYKVDIDRRPFPDPVWLWETSFGVKDEPCSQHWVEIVFGIDGKVAGPVHLGWSVRYRWRMAHNDGVMDNTWYVPGFGIQDSNKLWGTFNLSVDI